MHEQEHQDQEYSMTANMDLIDAVEHCSPDGIRAALAAHANPSLKYRWTKQNDVWSTSDHPSTEDASADRKPNQSLLHSLIYTSKDKPPALIHECFSLLLNAGADIEAKDLNGNRPIHSALLVEPYNRTALTLLLEAGAEVNAKGQFGFTPLHLAAGYRSEMPARLILAADADPQILDNKLGIYPLTVAIDHMNTAVADLIEGAITNPPKTQNTKKIKKALGLDLEKRENSLITIVEERAVAEELARQTAEAREHKAAEERSRLAQEKATASLAAGEETFRQDPLVYLAPDSVTFLGKISPEHRQGLRTVHKN